MKPRTLPTLTAVPLILAAALTLAGCGQKPTGPLPTYDLGTAIDNPKTFDLTEIAESIDFLPLDDSQPEGLLSGVSRLRETPGRLYIMDHTQRPVKIFDRSGRFIGTRGMIGRGPGEFTRISQIHTDPASDNLYIIGQPSGTGVTNRQAMIGFDADGKEFARNNSVPQGQILFSGGQIVAQTGVPSIDAAADGSDKSWTLIETYSLALEPTGRLDVPDTGTPRSMTGVSFMPLTYQPRATIHESGSGILVLPAMNDTVQIFRPGTGRGEPRLEPAFVLDLGAKTPPPSVFGFAPTVPWDARYYKTRDMHDGGRWLFLTVDNMGLNPTSGGKPNTPVVIDRAAGGAPGGAGGFTPLRPDGQPGYTLGGVPFTIVNATPGRLTGYIQAIDITDNAEAITHTGLRNLAATLKEDSNPVIVTLTLKQK